MILELVERNGGTIKANGRVLSKLEIFLAAAHGLGCVEILNVQTKYFTDSRFIVFSAANVLAFLSVSGTYQRTNKDTDNETISVLFT